MKKTCFSFVLVLACLGNSVWADGRGRHRKVYAVPRPGPVSIDGRLDDWDLSGQIWMYVVSATSEMQSAHFALMYDEQALYISGDVRDPSPMMNRHAPEVDGNRSWDADACQVRLVLDPAQGFPVNQSTYKPVSNRQMAMLTLWYYTDRKEPNMQMQLGMKYELPHKEWGPFGIVPRDLFRAAYRLADDKGGYLFEYRIPWTTLGAKAPLKGGDLVPGCVQFNWSRPDGLKTAGGGAWSYDVLAAPGFPYQSSACWGKVIFSTKGNLPGELVEEGVPPEKPLPLKFIYELPEDSEVTVQLFDKKGEVVKTLIAQGRRRTGRNTERWDGLDDQGRPLSAGEYIWKGLYHQPIKTRFLFSVHNSGRPPYKTDDNTGGWGGDHGSPTTACAVPDGMLLAWEVCESGWGIIRTNLKGKKRWGSKYTAEYLATDGKRFFTAGGYDWNHVTGVRVFDLADSRPLNFGNDSAVLGDPPGGDKETNKATGLAYRKGRLYVSYKARDLIAVYDASTGNLLDTWPAPAPGRLAPLPDGSFAVISGEQVLKVQASGNSPWISEPLDHPAGIVAGSDGQVYVANRGKLQCVSEFSGKGKFLRSIGRVGGRPPIGHYDLSGMLDPGGIALDKTGRLWVAETLDSPRRHSVWNVQTGKLIREFFGGSAYFGWAFMDPRHPDEIYCHNVIWKVDLNRRTWRPFSTIWRSTEPDMVLAATPGGYAGHLRVMTAHNGHQYAWGQAQYGSILYLRTGDVFKPLTGVIRLVRPGGYQPTGQVYTALDDKKKYPDGIYFWQDANDDQKLQTNEVQPLPRKDSRIYNWFDKDLNAWCDAGFLLPPVRVEPDGRPIYDLAKREAIPFRGSNSNATSLWLDPEEKTVFTLNPGRKPGLAAWKKDGTLLWAYPNIVIWNKALNLPVVTPGKLWGLTMPLGVAGDFTGAASYFGPYHIFTRDGLYVAMVMRDHRTGKLGPDITASETIMGQLVKPDGTDRYFLLAGDQDGRVTEILGLDTVRRLPGGTYRHAEEAVQKARTAYEKYRQQLASLSGLQIVRGRKALSLAKPVGKKIDDHRSFEARAAYDSQNLYFSFNVSSPNELQNAFPDDHRIFKGGNLIDIQLAADPNADPKRKKPAPGDVRILVTRQKEKPLIVLFRPKLSAFQGTPIVLSSPTGKESFDRIEITDQIKLAYRKKSGGFQATVTVPLELTGVQPRPAEHIRMDIGYIFGNKPGTQAAVRAYWHNNSFSANVVNDVPNESRLEPAEWGDALFE